MCTPQGIIEKVGCLVFDEAVKAAIERGKYVIDYKTNLKELQIEIRKLEGRREIIQSIVRKAKDDGKLVYTAVLDWLKDVDTMTRDVHNQLVGQTEADRMTPDVEEQLVGQTEVDGVIRDVQEQLVGRTEADGVTRDVQEQLAGQSSDTGNMSCFKWSCPNIKRRYHLSKEAKEKIAGVKKLIEESHFNENEISYRRPPPLELEFPSNENYVDLDSRTPVFERIVDALKDPSVNVIGVHGLGGVGKTTLVEEVGKKMRHNGTFKQVALAVVSKDLSVQKIQSQLADSLHFKWDANSNDQKGRANQLWDKFSNGERYLVILDDVWTKVDITVIGIPLIKGSTTGCKVVLASRNEDLMVNRMNVDKPFPIAELQELEAWTLFKKKVGDSIESQPELYSLASEVCKKCKGLPVAINALGEALKGKPNNAWKDALVKLERYMITNIEGIDPSVWASLKLSYDKLGSSNSKSCFLLCCLFHEDVEISIDDLMRHCVARSSLSPNPRTLEEARDAVRTLVLSLKSASLLSNGNDENVVKMHDVIRDVGISIARKEEEFLVDHGACQWPRNPTNGPTYKAMSLNFKNIKVLPDGLVYPQLETLMVANSELSDLEVPDTFFSGMMQLTVLTFTQMRMWQLPSSLAKLTNLRMLYLNECELGDIAVLKDLKSNLEVLSLRNSSIEALPLEIGQLTSLRVLDLQECYELKVIPRGVISNLTGLEELYFPMTFAKWGATTDEQQNTSNSDDASLEELRESLANAQLTSDNASLEELRDSLANAQLTTLHIHVPNVKLLPKVDLKFADLKGFRISVGSKFDYLEALISRTCMLKLEGIQLRNEFIPLVDKAEVLILKPKSSMRPLRLFNKLTVLIIEHFKLKYLFSPTTARGLVHLEVLKVTSCEIMEGIIGFEGQKDENQITGEVKFSKLKQLKLTSLPNLISFFAKKEEMGTTMESFSAHAQPLFNEQVIFPVLESLTIEGLDNIIKIWDKQSVAIWQEQGSFCQLTYVDVDKCQKLMHVFPSNMHPLLKNLEMLRVENCETMKGIAEFEGEIDEDGLRKEVAASPALEVEHLEMVELPKITEIRDKQPLLEPIKEVESLCKLMYLYIMFCDQLLYVFPSHMLPQNLQELFIQYCDELEVIFSKDPKEENEAINNDIIVFPRLKAVTLGTLCKLKSFYTKTQGSFFSHKVAFPILERLNFCNLSKITRIWDEQPLSEQEKEAKSFCQLMKIVVYSCDQLEYVLPLYMLPQLKNLQNLIISNCTKMEVIISNNQKEKEATNNNDTIRFPQLETVWFRALPNLESLCSDETQLFFSNEDAFPMLDKIYLDEYSEFLRKETCTKEASIEECGTSGQESDYNGEELDEDLKTPTKEVFMEECSTSGKENDHNGEELDEDLKTPTKKVFMEECGTSGPSGKENDHNW